MGSIRGLRRVFQVTELQACHRVFAPSRRDQDRERILVYFLVCLHFSIGRYHRCGSSWISAEFPIHLISNPFLLSMCIDAPESTTNSRSSGDFEVGAGVALDSIGSSKMKFHPLQPVFLSLSRHFSPSPMVPCGRILLAARFRLVSSPQGLGAHGLRS